MEAAAQRYFGKRASRLTLRGGAILAGVVKSPTAYNPADAPEKAGQRSQLVLDAMLETGAITPASRAKALAQVVRVQQSAPTAPAQYFVDWLDGQWRGLVGATRQDLVVETTLDLPMEEPAAQTARATVPRDKAQNVEQAALVALDGSGRGRAMLGGLAYAASAHNRATDAHRQAGSAWKPF